MNFLKNQAPNSKTRQEFLTIKRIKPNSKVNHVVNYVINQCLFFKDNYFESEKTIAKTMEVSETTVKRALRIARESGIIKRKRRFNGIQTSSNVYKLNPSMKHESIIDEFASVLPALRGLLCLSFLLPSMAWLEPRSNHCIPENDLLYSKNEVFIKAKQALSSYKYSTKNQVAGPEAGKMAAKEKNSLKGNNATILQSDKDVYNYLAQFDWIILKGTP
jgi:DNA-binding Lrp family transcriptional regulator